MRIPEAAGGLEQVRMTTADNAGTCTGAQPLSGGGPR
jgi:hypothetical protein